MPPFERTHPGFGSPTPHFPGAFLHAVRAACDQLGWTAARWLGGAVVCCDAKGDEKIIVLSNVYQNFRSQPRDAWAGRLADLFRSLPEHDGGGASIGALDDLVDRVLPRLFTNPSGLEWHRWVVEGQIALGLVVDFPNTVAFLSPEKLATSDRDAEGWLAVALENLKKRTPPDALRERDAPDAPWTVSVGDSYDAVRVLLLSELFPCDEGHVVAIPDRDTLLALPGSAPESAIAALAETARTKHAAAEHPLSPGVFRVVGGVWTALPG